MSTQPNWNIPPLAKQPPDFNNLLAVLQRQPPSRPTLFEFFLNAPLYKRLAPSPPTSTSAAVAPYLTTIHAFRNAGYDYTTVIVPNFGFDIGEIHKQQTRSLNEGSLITDRASFDAYNWPDPDAADYSILNDIAPHIPQGMKLIIYGPCGVLENALQIVGYENLCYIVIDDEQLAHDIFTNIGQCLVNYYKHALKYDIVGAIIGNDDWGFKSQTMLAPDDMRRFVFPWHKQIVAHAHAAGKPAILHSCGCLASVMDDVIDDMKYDAKHSYEDIIQPVEQAYDQYHDRIAILGGIDVDFVCRSTPQQVYDRASALLARSQTKGAYALGTGNSVPEYIPDQNYFAMIRAALDAR